MADMQQETTDEPAKRRATPKPAPEPRTPAPPTADSKGRQPIPIAKIQFNVHRAHTSPGLQQQTSVKARGTNGPGHDLAYLPWVRAFRLTFWPNKDGPPHVCYVPEGEVTCWTPAAGVEL